jgi:signal transduction histidine kinase
MAEDDALVTQITSFSMVIRLGALVLVLLVPISSSLTAIGMVAVLFVLLTSTYGLLRSEQLSHAVTAHPLLVVVDVLAATAVGFSLGTDSPILFFTLSTALLVGLLLEPHFAVPVVITLMASHVLAAQRGDLELTLATVLVLPAMYVVLCALGLLVRRLHTRTLDEQARVRQLVHETATERERARLARDMHDSVAKSLHGIGLAAAALPAWIRKDVDAAAQKARELQSAAETAAAEARAMLTGLRRDQDDRPLAEILRSLAEDVTTRSGIPVEVHLRGIGDCDHEVKHELVQMTGEALENVARHSHATAASLTCRATERHIDLDIVDDGVGFDADACPDGHYGLVGLSERAGLVGGTVRIDSTPGHGTTVRLRVPRIHQGATV